MRWASTVLLACEFSGGHRVGVLHHLRYVVVCTNGLGWTPRGSGNEVVHSSVVLVRLLGFLVVVCWLQMTSLEWCFRKFQAPSVAADLSAVPCFTRVRESNIEELCRSAINVRVTDR